MHGMPIEMVVQKNPALMRESGVTILARPAPFGHRQGEAAAGDSVVAGLVAVVTLEAKAAHMDVAAAGMEIENRIELTMLDRIFSPACKMAGAAGLPAGFTHISGDM